MAKIQLDARTETLPHRNDVPPLTAGTRRHLGKTLRSHYAATLAEPVSERLEMLLAKLQTPPR
ncbi:hypothetical protein [Methylobacterium gnaphalii]|uniref:Anti-sigma factor NepR domain-containing protein n=1 Tax=Methylobacterium gnaphalii TaxID=1010610 RepID=A0A512JI71_9HYPH|nr:hypothetical protein [Methylobacterium gnaphalii]GEP09657.1 hypothetical protein MGN01_15020 [Methylobacterium gnaphalii]GJD67756.1 hypothetical protein MMMDOFMJ_0672 [Methylobacterium gnaphalii]GLS50075.1 hypothetical protein GCM10007885_29270 [Methylobacterium gnaphalii]